MTTEKKAKKAKRAFLSQKEFPREPLAKALEIAKAMWDHFAGKSAPPHDVALAMNLAPTSGHWRNLTGTAIAYGLTEGGFTLTKFLYLI